VILALALCLEGQGKLASAMLAYREGLFFARRDKRADREKAAQQKLAELEPQLSQLVIRVDPAAVRQGLVVRVDANELPAASYGLAIPVDGGKHEIEARAEGFVTRTLTVEIERSKDRKEVTLAPLAAVASVVEAPPPAPTRTPDERVAPPRATVVPTLGLAIGALGVATLLTGGYFGIRAVRGAHDVASACPNGLCHDVADVDRNEGVKRDARVSDVLLISGALYVVGRPSSAKSVGVSPSLAPGAVGFAVSGHF
jgi:hypothetical protein